MDQSQIQQTIEDIPPVRPRVTRLTTYEATCVRCGQSVRSSHPLQMSLASGAESASPTTPPTSNQHQRVADAGIAVASSAPATRAAATSASVSYGFAMMLKRTKTGELTNLDAGGLFVRLSA